MAASHINDWEAGPAASLAVSPATLGNGLLLAIQYNSGTPLPSGGGARWRRIVTYPSAPLANNLDLWLGVVTKTGAGTIAGIPAGSEIICDEFDSGLGLGARTDWVIVASGTNTGTTDPDPYTSEPLNSGLILPSIYYGYGYVFNVGEAGSDPGFTYRTTAPDSSSIGYNAGLAADTAYQPAFNDGSPEWSSVGAIVAAVDVASEAQFPVTPIIITGVGANGPLPSPWEGPAWEDPDEIVISSNFMTSGGNDEGTSMYDVLLNADQESYVTITQFSTEDVHAPALLHLRMDGINGTGAGYYCGVDSTGEFGIFNAVTFGLLYGPITVPGVANGSSLGFRAQGSVLSAWHKPPGGAWGLIVSIVDTTFKSGGFLYMDCADNTFNLSNFGGGNLTEFLENEDTLDLLLLENGTPIELETSQ